MHLFMADVGFEPVRMRTRTSSNPTSAMNIFYYGFIVGKSFLMICHKNVFLMKTININNFPLFICSGLKVAFHEKVGKK